MCHKPYNFLMLTLTPNPNTVRNPSHVHTENMHVVTFVCTLAGR